MLRSCDQSLIFCDLGYLGYSPVVPKVDPGGFSIKTCFIHQLCPIPVLGQPSQGITVKFRSSFVSKEQNQPQAGRTTLRYPSGFDLLQDKTVCADHVWLLHCQLGHTWQSHLLTFWGMVKYQFGIWTLPFPLLQAPCLCNFQLWSGMLCTPSASSGSRPDSFVCLLLNFIPCSHQNGLLAWQAAKEFVVGFWCVCSHLLMLSTRFL